jgi:PAS domain S-box-containing protein
MIWRANASAKCDYFNRRWLEFTGRSIEQEFGDGWAEGVHPDDRDRCFRTFIDAFERREPFEMEYRLRRYDGEFRWVLDAGTPVADGYGVFSGYVGSAIDITDRVDARATLARANLRELGFEGV